MFVCLDLRNGSGCGTQNRSGAQHCRHCGNTLRFALKLHDADTRIGHYQILRVLGHGGFGAVYAAADTRRPELRVALKETFDPNSITSFQGEFEVLNCLQHPNLPSYYEMFERNDYGYLVMELVPGQSLADVLARQPDLPLLESQSLGFMLQLCDVLSYLHSQQPTIIHRDIKPANIRLTPEGLIKLVDFGLLKQGHDATQNSRRGLTPGYAPIEQWGGDEQRTNIRSDIYSLGATLYHLLTGKRPSPATERIAAASDPLLSPRHHNSSLSPHVADAVMTAMALTQKDRFADAVSMKRALMGMGQSILDPGLLRTRPGHAGGTLSIAWSPDGRGIASGGRDKAVRLWSAADDGGPPQLQLLEGATAEVGSVAWSPDGQLIAGGSRDGRVRIWRAADGSLLHTLKGHGGEVASVAFSPNGQLLVSAGRDKAVRLWNVADAVLLHTFEGHTGSVRATAFAADGQLLASISMDSTVRLWRPPSVAGASGPALLHTLREQTRGKMYSAYIEATFVNASVAFSPDGQTLASTNWDSTVRLWRAPSATAQNKRTTDNSTTSSPVLLRTLQGHTDGVTSVAFSLDGQTLASGSSDKSVRLWRVADGYLLHSLTGHTDVVTSVAYSPDRQTLASGSLDGTVRIWRV